MKRFHLLQHGLIFVPVNTVENPLLVNASHNGGKPNHG